MRSSMVGLGLSAWLVTAVVAAAQGHGTATSLREESRSIAVRFAQQVEHALSQSLHTGATLRAINVCRYTAVELASELSRKGGLRIARVSLRPWNPSVSAADDWEQRVLADFEQSNARGVPAEDLEHGEVVEEPSGRAYRFMRAIPVRAGCMGCHGSPEQITAAMRDALLTSYPKLPGSGLRLGQVAGAVSIRRAF